MKIDIFKFEDHELKFLDASIEFAHKVADNKPIVLEHLNLVLIPLHITTPPESAEPLFLHISCGPHLVHGVGAHVEEPSDFTVTFNKSGYADPLSTEPIHARELMCDTGGFVGRDLGAFDERAPMSATFNAEPSTTIKMVLVCALAAPWHASIDLSWSRAGKWRSLASLPDPLLRFMKLCTIENLNAEGRNLLGLLLRELDSQFDAAGPMPA